MNREYRETYEGKATARALSGWRVERISNISKHCLGKMLDKAKNKGTMQPYLRNLNVRWFEFDLSDLNQMPFFPEESARYQVEKGDVVICEGGYPGRAAVWDSDDPIYFQKALHRVRFTNPLHAKWFVYYLYLQDQTNSLRQWFTGTGILHFTGEALARFELPLPPDSQLPRLIALLDEVFDGISHARANTQRSLGETRNLFTRFLDIAFARLSASSSNLPIGDIAAVKGGKRTPNGYKLETDPTPYPYLRVTDFNDYGSIDQSNLRYVSESVHAVIKKYVISSRDLYISIAGTIGKTGIIPPELEGAQLTENACRLVFKDDVWNRYVYLFTRTSWFAERLGLNTRTTAQPKLALSRLATILVPIPSLEVQRELVAESADIFRETDRLASIQEQKLSALENLKLSLLNEAFSGNL